MKFIVKKGSDTFEKLEKLIEKVDFCKDEANKLAKELGSKERVLTSNRRIAGGIDGIQLDKKPENWKQAVPGQHHGYYIPKKHKGNKEVLEKLANLPIVTTDEFNETVGFKQQFVSLAHIQRFGLVTGKNFFLIDMHDGVKYEPVEGMEEILGSKYQKLEEEIKNEEKC